VELLNQCGPPIDSYRSAKGSDVVCVAYKSYAHSIAASSAVAPYYVVCLRPWSYPRKSTETTPFLIPLIPPEQLRNYVVESVYGLQSIPGTLTSSTPR
jgi:hypothetical protein